VRWGDGEEASFYPIVLREEREGILFIILFTFFAPRLQKLMAYLLGLVESCRQDSVYDFCVPTAVFYFLS
jgi:hypothetical protein